MVATPPAAAGGSQTAFTYSSEPQAVPPKRSSVRSKYREDAAATPDAQWMDENDVSTTSRDCGLKWVSEMLRLPTKDPDVILGWRTRGSVWLDDTCLDSPVQTALERKVHVHHSKKSGGSDSTLRMKWASWCIRIR